MIIPTADFNPMFAQDGVPFREKMLAYIGREFGDLLASQPAAAAVINHLAQESAATTLPLPQPTASRQDRAA